MSDETSSDVYVIGEQPEPAPSPEPADTAPKDAPQDQPEPSPDPAPEPEPDGDKKPDPDDDSSDEAWGKIAPPAEEKKEETPKAHADEEGEQQSKGMVPSYRLREIREEAAKTQEAKEARIRELEAMLPENQQIEQQVRRLADEDQTIQTGRKALEALDQLYKDAAGSDEAKKANALALFSQYGIATEADFAMAKANLTAEIRDRAKEIQSTVKGQFQRQKDEAAQAEAAARTALESGFRAKIGASKLPEVTKAVARIEANAAAISPTIREWMMHSDDADEIAAAIGGSANLFSELSKLGNKPLNAFQFAQAIRRVDAHIGKQKAARTSIQEESRESHAEKPESKPRGTAVRSGGGASPKNYRSGSDGTIFV